MGKIKSTVKEVRTEARTLACKVAAGDLTLDRTERILFIAMAVFTMLFFAAGTIFAGDLFGKIEDSFWLYYKRFAGMATIVALLAITIGLLWIMLSPSSHSSATPIAWIKKVFLCYFLLMIIGGIFGVINDLTAGQGWDSIPR